jgi:hypothetical protein
MIVVPKRGVDFIDGRKNILREALLKRRHSFFSDKKKENISGV